MTSPLCLFFGCWGRPGHHLVGPGGSRVVGQSDLPNSEAYDLCNALDSGFAPRRTSSGLIVFGLATFGMGWEIRTAEELPQGQFLRHRHGRWTLLQWWDRCQGDTRGACNSTVLLEGDRTTGGVPCCAPDELPRGCGEPGQARRRARRALLVGVISSMVDRHKTGDPTFPSQRIFGVRFCVLSLCLSPVSSIVWASLAFRLDVWWASFLCAVLSLATARSAFLSWRAWRRELAHERDALAGEVMES